MVCVSLNSRPQIHLNGNELEQQMWNQAILTEGTVTSEEGSDFPWTRVKIQQFLAERETSSQVMPIRLYLKIPSDTAILGFSWWCFFGVKYWCCRMLNRGWDNWTTPFGERGRMEGQGVRNYVFMNSFRTWNLMWWLQSCSWNVSLCCAQSEF